jgi:hypothetical protein
MKNSEKSIHPQVISNINSKTPLSEVWNYEVNHGLSKREYFAGLALQGLLSSNNSQTPEYLAVRALKAADELLQQLEK